MALATVAEQLLMDRTNATHEQVYLPRKEERKLERCFLPTGHAPTPSTMGRAPGAIEETVVSRVYRVLGFIGGFMLECRGLVGGASAEVTPWTGELQDGPRRYEGMKVGAV